MWSCALRQILLHKYPLGTIQRCELLGYSVPFRVDRCFNPSSPDVFGTSIRWLYLIVLFFPFSFFFYFSRYKVFDLRPMSRGDLVAKRPNSRYGIIPWLAGLRRSHSHCYPVKFSSFQGQQRNISKESSGGILTYTVTH